MRQNHDILASPFDRGRVLTPGGAVLSLGIRFSLVCHGPSVSDQNASEQSTTQTLTATDQGAVTTGTQSPIVQPGAAATGGPSSPIVGQGAISLQDVSGLLSPSGNGSVTITSSDAQTLEKGLEAIVALAANNSQVVTDLAQKQQDGTTGNLNAILDSIANLAETKQTEGASLISKTLLWIGLAVAAVFAIRAYRRS